MDEGDALLAQAQGLYSLPNDSCQVFRRHRRSDIDVTGWRNRDVIQLCSKPTDDDVLDAMPVERSQNRFHIDVRGRHLLAPYPTEASFFRPSSPLFLEIGTLFWRERGHELGKALVVTIKKCEPDPHLEAGGRPTHHEASPSCCRSDGPSASCLSASTKLSRAAAQSWRCVASLAVSSASTMFPCPAWLLCRERYWAIKPSG